MDLSKDLCISSQEIGSILTRTEKLRVLHPDLTRGRDTVGLILASAILYVRWSGSKRNPMPPRTFVTLCQDKEYPIDMKLLNRNMKMYREAGLYPQVPKASELLERRWHELQQKANLNDENKAEILEILKNRKFVTGRPEVAVATAVYAVCYERNVCPYQTENDLAELFGTTDVTMRLVIKRWLAIPEFRNRYSKLANKGS